MRQLITAAILFSAHAFAQTTCLNFPAGLIPLSSIAYVTASNFTGDRLVVGALASGLNTLSAIPLPTAANQLFCDASIQLAAQQFYPSVYVPTTAERGGNFSAFSGLLVDPANNAAFPGGVIPTNRLGAVFAFRIAAEQTTDTSRNWSPTGSMSTVRYSHASVLLPSGKVFIVGDLTLGNSAELYDPATGTFTKIGTTLFPHALGNTATLLNDGRVLIVGGGINAPAFAELFDPASGRFTATGAPAGMRALHSATLLADGRVLVAGGSIGVQPITAVATAEIYDPRTGVFTATGSMTIARSLHTATLLNDGRVLMRGSAFIAGFTSAETYDPASGRFSSVGTPQIPRQNHFAALLPNGRVLIGGGIGIASAQAEEFDPATGTFALRGSLGLDRQGASATLLPNGLVLVAGGLTGSRNNNTAVLYNPATGLFVPTGSLRFGQHFHRATLLLDGRVLTTGGLQDSNVISSAELYTPVTQGLVTSQTGLTFRAAQGAGALPSQTVAALSPTDTIPYNVSVKTFTGGGWLKATPAGGTSGPTSPPVSLTITADATGLPATDYYGTVTLSPTDGKHSPVSIAIVLTVVPAGAAAAPGVTPSGLVFLTPTGRSPAAQTFTISNVTSRALTFTSAATQTPTFFDYTPKTGSINAGQSQTITVTPSSAALAAGAYRGSIRLNFSDNSTQTVDVLLVASDPAGTSASPESSRSASRDATCVPTKLLPVLTSIGAGFSTPLAWPTSIVVQVVDTCGTAINAGNVTASFTNGDLPLSLISIGNGMWSATWVPVRPSVVTGVRADAQSLALAGSVQVNGGVAANPKVPVVASGGVLSSGDYLGSPAQGLLASIFGVALADGALGNSGLPLPQQLGSTTVLVSGVSVPVLYVSENQLNVFIPYELAVNTPHQLIVQRANAISVPAPISVFENQPAILATAGNGAGQGHIYRIDASGAQILADASVPAKAGDVLVIYSVGLGPVNPPLKSGDPAPLTFLEPITGTASVTIGGVPAKVEFAGLTPGFSGLYQVNVTVPAGITAGNQVPVTVSVNGRAGAGNIFMAIQ